MVPQVVPGAAWSLQAGGGVGLGRQQLVHGRYPLLRQLVWVTRTATTRCGRAVGASIGHLAVHGRGPLDQSCILPPCPLFVLCATSCTAGHSFPAGPGVCK